MQPDRCESQNLAGTSGRCAYRCTDKCKYSDRVDAGQGGSVNIGLDVLVVRHHRLEDGLVPEKSTADLSASE